MADSDSVAHSSSERCVPYSRLLAMRRSIERSAALSDLLLGRLQGLQCTPSLRELVAPTIGTAFEVKTWSALTLEHLGELLREDT